MTNQVRTTETRMKFNLTAKIAGEETAFLSEFSTTTSGQVVGALVLLRFNNRGRSELINRTETGSHATSLR